MTWIISLVTALASSAVLKAIVTRVLIALGFSLATYTGVRVGVAAIWTQMSTNFSAMPTNVIALLSMMHIPQALNVIISAYVGALAVKGLTALGSISKFSLNPSNPGAFGTTPGA